MEIARDWLVFAIAVPGAGAALAPSADSFSPLEAWCTGMATALVVLGAGVFGTYVAHLDNGWFATGFVTLAIAVVLRRRRVLELWRDPAVREAALAWGLLCLGGLALLGCVHSYSGGAWMGDWEEHYQRPRLFLRLRQEDEEFRRLFTLPARPPLASTADAALLWATSATFGDHQVFMLLVGSLAFFPIAMFAGTFGGGRAAATAAALLLLFNPMFMQNLTYAWTKLPTVFFVLAGLHVLLGANRGGARAVTGFGLLTLGVLTHYSACVWLVVFGAAWIWSERGHWREPEFRRTAGWSALISSLLLLPWVAYAISRYGLAATLGSNTAFTTASRFSWWDNVLSAGPKLWDTLVPHPLRTMDRSVFDQANPWAHLRDYLFAIYQSNLFFGIGTGGLLVLGWLALRPAARPAWPGRAVWLWTVPAVIVLGTAVHGHVDEWGCAHICLQPLMLLGLALVSALLPRLLRTRGESWLAAGLALGCVLDGLLGIWLHFGVTAWRFGRAPGEDLMHYIGGLSRIAQYNFWQMARLHEDFMAMRLDAAPGLLGVLFAAVLLVLGVRTWRLSADRAQVFLPPVGVTPP